MTNPGICQRTKLVMSEKFQIRFLDHVAIRARDIEKSAQWYENTLGLKRYTFKEWGSYPIFMLAGKTGLAIFPAKTDNPKSLGGSDWINIDHFAFNVDPENFVKARRHYEALNIEYVFQDHTFFHSIYTNDPDGHKVELTTLVVDPEAFYT